MDHLAHHYVVAKYLLLRDHWVERYARPEKMEAVALHLDFVLLFLEGMVDYFEDEFDTLRPLLKPVEEQISRQYFKYYLVHQWIVAGSIC